MKNLIVLLVTLVAGSMNTQAATTEDKVATSNAYVYNNSFIFVENGITFSVYPDGEFDFYIDNRVNVGASLNLGRTNITFNSGFDYNSYVQYDDYGAVIQIENVPVYYDYYGRVSQIGDVNVWYRNGRVNRIGGLYVYYNNRGYYTHCSGYVNIYNRHYVYAPFHRYFIRPAVGFCLVYNRPYRRYYHPIRYSYYAPYRYNRRHAYARIGHDYAYHKEPRRAKIYRNDKRVVVRDNRYRRDAVERRSVATRDKKRVVSKRTATRSQAKPQRQTAVRSNTRTVTRKEPSKANSRNSSATRRTVTQRSATRSPVNKTVTTRSRTTYRTPQPGNNRASKSQNRTDRRVTTRSANRNSNSYKRSSVRKSVDSRATKVTRSNSTRRSSRSNKH